MTQHSQKLLLLIAITSLVITTAGCPTPPSSVQDELTDWPARQVDPTDEDTAGFNQVISADMNGDGLVDLITAAYESQPIQVHLQQRAADGTISFDSFSVAGSAPIVRISDIAVADIDQDGNLDIIVSVLDTGLVSCGVCPGSPMTAILILFAPADTRDAFGWVEFPLTNNFDPDGRPCKGFGGSYDSICVADVSQDGYPDIIAAFNGAGPLTCLDTSDGCPGFQVELWLNPANDQIRIENEPEGDPAWLRIPLQRECLFRAGGQSLEFVGPVSMVRCADVDRDGDLDVVALRPDSASFDISWQENPLPDSTVAAAFWPQNDRSGPIVRPIGESDTGFDLIEIGDLDGDGLDDVLAVVKTDRLLRWFQRPLDPAAQTFPWDVFNMVQFDTLTPTAMDIAEVDVNGQLGVVAAAGGHIRWFTPLSGSPFESWSERFVVSDAMIGDSSATVGSSPFFPINSVHAVDIDDDGRLDIVATFDREGTDNDVIVWFQNTEIEAE